MTPALVLGLAVATTATGSSPKQQPAPAEHPVLYTVVDLGRIGWTGDVAAINDSGVATGTVNTGSTFYGRRWPGAELPEPDYLASTALAINASGAVVGATARDGNNGTLLDDGAMWKTNRLQGVPPVVVASGINDSGLVVGYDSVNNLGSRAVAWRNGTLLTFAPLAPISNAWVAWANAVNNANTVVGKSLVAPGVEHAFSVQVGARGVGPTVDLDTLPPPFNESNAFGINDRGAIVGASGAGFGPNSSHAVTWTKGAISDLGAELPSSWGGSAAFGINEAGEIVGLSGTSSTWVDGSTGTVEGERAVLWHNGAAFDLNNTISGGWHLCIAHDVNNLGEIVGNGFAPGDAIPHGFMLVPRVRLASLTLNPSSVVSGRNTEATVTLTQTAPPGGETVFITDSSASVDVPQTITVPPGRASVVFTISTEAVKKPAFARITATFNGQSQSTSLSLLAKAAP